MKIHGLTIDPSAGRSGLLLQRLGDGLNVVVDAHDLRPGRDAVYSGGAVRVAPRRKPASRRDHERALRLVGRRSSAAGPVEVRRTPRSARPLEP